MSDYKITEQDIAGMLNYLRVFHPENANRDFAVEILHYMKAGYRRIALTDPDALDSLYVEFTREQTS